MMKWPASEGLSSNHHFQFVHEMVNEIPELKNHSQNTTARLNSALGAFAFIIHPS